MHRTAQKIAYQFKIVRTDPFISRHKHYHLMRLTLRYRSRKTKQENLKSVQFI